MEQQNRGLVKRLSYSQKLMGIVVLKIIGFMVLFVSAAYFGLGWSIDDIVKNKQLEDPRFAATGIIIFLSFLLGMAEMTAIMKIDSWLDRQIYKFKNAFKGNAGEKKTFDELIKSLGSEYKLYRNFPVPGYKFDIDAIIVGPKGIVTFEIKNIGGKYDTFLFESSDVYKINEYPNGDVLSRRLGPASSPVEEAMRHNSTLEAWLKENEFPTIKVRGAILMVSSAKIEVKYPLPVYVIKGTERIEKYFQDAYEDPIFKSYDFRAKLSALLDANS